MNFQLQETFFEELLSKAENSSSYEYNIKTNSVDPNLNIPSDVIQVIKEYAEEVLKVFKLTMLVCTISNEQSIFELELIDDKAGIIKNMLQQKLEEAKERCEPKDDCDSSIKVDTYALNVTFCCDPWVPVKS